MPFAEFAKRTVYVAHKSVNNNGVMVYSEPVEYRISCNNVLPTSTSADLIKIGTSFSEILYAVGDPEYLKEIKEFDRVYVFAKPSATFDPLAQTADFYVDSVLDFPQCTRLILVHLDTDGE